MAKKDEFPPTTGAQDATLDSYGRRVGRPLTMIVLRDGRVALRIHGSGARSDANILIRRDGEVEADSKGHAKKALDGYLKRRRREAAASQAVTV
jgi:hypothetical protein